MYSTFVLSTLFASSALAFPHLADFQSDSELVTRQENASTLKPQHFTWEAPGPDDVRSPCPLVNTLANHGFLPHNGRNISLAALTTAIKDGINFGAVLASTPFNVAINGNPDASATTIDLDMLHIHNFIEHDGSLSRQDSALDKTNQFNADVFDAYLAYYDGAEEFTIEAAANARARHAQDMSKTTPNFSLTRNQIATFLSETAMMLHLWNQGTSGTADTPVANRTMWEYFFRNERFPVELGWAPTETEFAAGLNGIMAKLQAATPAGVPLSFNPGLLE